MQKAPVHQKQEVNTIAQKKSEDDEWETGDVTPMSEKEQRWGKGKEIQPEISLDELVQQTKKAHDTSKLKDYKQDSFSRGYGVANQKDKALK